MTEIGITLDALLKHDSVKAIGVEETVTEYANLFKKELGLLRGIEADVSVEQSATPRFHKCRPVPFALRDKVEDAIEPR